MAILVEAGFENAKQLLDVSLGFDVVPAFILSALREHADEFGFLVSYRESQVVADTIDAAVSNGWTPGRLATEISNVFAQGYHVVNDGVVQRIIPTHEWATMVARTELSRAQTMGAIALYKEAKIRKVLWATTEGANVCPECAARDGQVYSLADYESDPAPLHPNCACAALPADKDVVPAHAA